MVKYAYKRFVRHLYWLAKPCSHFSSLQNWYGGLISLIESFIGVTSFTSERFDIFASFSTHYFLQEHVLKLLLKWAKSDISLLLIHGKTTVFAYVALSDPDYMKFQQWLGPFHMDWRTTMHENEFLAIFQECRHYSWKSV